MGDPAPAPITVWWRRYDLWGRNTTSGDCTISWPDDLVLEREFDGYPFNAGINGAPPPEKMLSPGQPLGIGIGCILLGALLIAAGTSLIRRAAKSERMRREPHRQRAYPCQPGYCLGAVLLLLGHLGMTIAFVFAAGWLVSLLSLTALLWNLPLARFVSGEPVAGRTIAGVGLIVCGLSAFVVFGSPAPTTRMTSGTLNERWVDSLGEPFWITAAAVTGLVTATLLGCDLRLLCSHERAVERRVAREQARKGEGGEPSGEVSLDTALKALGRTERRALRLLYPLASALLAGWIAVLLETFSLTLQSYLAQPTSCTVGATVGGWACAKVSTDDLRPLSWVVIAAVSCMPVQHHLLVRGLTLFEAQLVLPTFFAFFVPCAVGGAAVFHGLFDRPDCIGWRFAPLFGGLACAIAGVLVLATTRNEPSRLGSQRSC